MKKILSLLFALATALQAQTGSPAPASTDPLPTATSEVVGPTGETSISLDFSNGIRAVLPSHVTVPAGELLRITGPNYGGRPLIWSKNGVEIPGATSTTLVINGVTAADAGTYAVGASDPLAIFAVAQTLVLGVGPADRLLNLSTRGTIAAGAGQSFISGFVVAGSTSQSKRLILRAVGPSLANFGVANPLRAPVLRIFDSAGKPYNNGYVYPPVVGGPTYESDLAASLAKIGAFPIASGTLDVVFMMPFPPGAYTAQVTSADNTAGTVLLEIYEVP